MVTGVVYRETVYQEVVVNFTFCTNGMFLLQQFMLKVYNARIWTMWAYGPWRCSETCVSPNIPFQASNKQTQLFILSPTTQKIANTSVLWLLWSFWEYLNPQKYNVSTFVWCVVVVLCMHLC